MWLYFSLPVRTSQQITSKDACPIFFIREGRYLDQRLHLSLHRSSNYSEAGIRVVETEDLDAHVLFKWAEEVNIKASQTLKGSIKKRRNSLMQSASHLLSKYNSWTYSERGRGRAYGGKELAWMIRDHWLYVLVYRSLTHKLAHIYSWLVAAIDDESDLTDPELVVKVPVVQQELESLISWSICNHICTSCGIRGWSTSFTADANSFDQKLEPRTIWLWYHPTFLYVYVFVHVWCLRHATIRWHVMGMKSGITCSALIPGSDMGPC